MAEVQSTVTVDSVPVGVTTLPWNTGTAEAEAITLRDPLTGYGASIVAPGGVPGWGLATTALGVSGTLQASGLQSASGAGSTVLPTLSMRELQLFLSVSAISVAGGTLTVFIQSQDPASGNWFDVGSFGQITYDGTEYFVDGVNVGMVLPALASISLGSHPNAKALTGANVRLRWDINAANFTFSVGYVGK